MSSHIKPLSYVRPLNTLEIITCWVNRNVQSVNGNKECTEGKRENMISLQRFVFQQILFIIQNHSKNFMKANMQQHQLTHIHPLKGTKQEGCLKGMWIHAISDSYEEAMGGLRERGEVAFIFHETSKRGKTREVYFFLRFVFRFTSKYSNIMVNVREHE